MSSRRCATQISALFNRHCISHLSSMAPSKRTADENDRSISPPPVKRKIQSTISKSAVATFFTPISQKPPKERTRVQWSERSPDEDSPGTLLVGRYEPETEETGTAKEPEAKRRKVVAFDLDSTLITSASGKKFGDDASDWKWWDRSVPTKLRSMYKDEGYRIVILSNQAGLTLHPDPNSKGPKTPKDRVSPFKQKASDILTQLNIPTTLYAATGKDIFRKPRTGMWTELCEDYELLDVDKENSVFVGDAGGRKAQTAGGKAVPKDFSCSDRNFAHNVGIKYQTPEEFFLAEPERDFTRDFDIHEYPFAEDAREEAEASTDNHLVFEKKNAKDVVLFCGPPGAGKSTFYFKYLKPLGYERVNQDILKSKDKCLKVAKELLEDGDSVVVDNTNPDPDIRKQWIDLANKHKVPIRCVWFRTPLALAEHNDVVRSLNKELNPEKRTALPKLAFNGFKSRYKPPSDKESFQDIVEVDFKFRGTKEEYGIWGRYWL